MIQIFYMRQSLYLTILCFCIVLSTTTYSQVELSGISNLRKYDGTITENGLIQITTPNWTSGFRYDPNDVTTPDDGVLTIVNGNKRFKRIVDAYTLNVKWFGAVGDFNVKKQTGTDNTEAFQNALNFFAANKDIVNFKMFIPAGNYWIKNTLATPNGASWFTIEGEDKRTTTLYWGKRGNGGDFIKLVNCQHGVLRNFSLVGQTGSAGMPDRMININRDASLVGSFGMIGDVTLENIYCNGALGKFRDGLAFTCNTANDGPADANNEQASILNCYFELAGRYGIAFQHQNSLWHRIIGGRVSGYSACIVNHREDGSTGGSFQLMNTTVMGLTDTSKLFQLVSAAYPISIINTESEGGSILLQSRGDARVTFTNCSWKLSNASANNVEISNTSRVTFENCLFLAPLGVNFIVKDPTSYLFIHGGSGNVNRISYAGGIAIDGYSGLFDANVLVNLGGGVARVGNLMADNNALYRMLTSNSSSINADEATFFELQPRTQTVYTSITNGYVGKEICLYIGSSKVQFGGSLSPTGQTISFPNGSIVKFVKLSRSYGSTWALVDHSTNIPKRSVGFAQTSDITVSNTTTEKSLIGAGSGSNIIPANTLSVGQTIIIKGAGVMSTGNTGGNLSFKYAGSSPLMNANVVADRSLNNANVEFEFTAIVRATGSSGSMQAVGWVSVNGVKTYLGNSTLNLNTTVPQTLDVRVKWANASPANSITTKILKVEVE